MKKYLFLTSLICLSFSVFSIFNSRFSGDPEKYTSELKEFTKNVSGEGADVINKFIDAWDKDSVFSVQEKEDIMRLSQKLEKKKARPYPHFVNFLKCLIVMQQNNVDNVKYSGWVEGIEFYLDQRKRNIGLMNNLLLFSSNFFTDLTIYKSPSTQWKVSSNHYKVISREGLMFEFENTELICYTPHDSIRIYETMGLLNPEEKIWRGKGGKVTWERAGFSPDEVFATLKEYEVSLNKSEYEADNVIFTNKKYFEEPLDGDLKDKVKSAKTPDNATYPKFFSYAKQLTINGLYEGVDYRGGLSMQGARLVGTGSRENPAHINIYKKDTLVLTASSLYFGIKSDRIASEGTSVSIKIHQDSIYHPDLFFMFRVADRELTLLKTDSYSSMGPYYNSYHNVDMNFDQLTWRIDEDFMHFSAARGTTIGKAYFESTDYFNFDKFVEMQMMDDAHPLVSVRSFARYYGSEEFSLEAYAAYLKMSKTQVRSMIMRLAFGGFVFYDDNSEMVRIKPRLNNYLAASINKIDYDVMGFSSNVEAPVENAVLDLRNYDLRINGIPRIQVSDSQNVVIYPKNESIILKKNRQFEFDGTVVAGLMTFYGDGFDFSYDTFKVNLKSVDSVNIGFLTGEVDNFGIPVVERSKNVLQKVTGEIFIDKPDNKSGRVSYPEYPVFRSKVKSYVYYNAGSSGESSDTGSFNFAVDPFEMDSLDNFNAKSMVFDGEFSSAGIFPDLANKLSIQPDNSLGFSQETPPGGMPVFGGKGTYYSRIWLSNDGLKGDGRIEYLTSTTYSDEFVFYPDSMNTIAKEYTIKKQSSGVQYPQTDSKNNFVHWEPYNDVMYASKKDVDFTIFNDTTKLAGVLKLEPTGLTGKGRMDLKNSDLASENFKFDANQISADTSEFYLKSLKAEGFTVIADNINSNINFTQRVGEFKSNEEYTLITFPENNYISYIDYYTWDMEGKSLSMGTKTKPELPDYTEEDTEPDGPRFISTDPKQDSINFIATLAVYDYKNNYLNASGVKFIEVADARIFPNSGLVTVKPDNKIKTLVDARVKANRTSKFHELYSATINIEGKKSYSGMANYDYIDENEDKQLIHFDEVYVDTGGHTACRAEIYENRNFKISPVFTFQGKVRLFADDSLLTFDGATKIEHNCDKIKSGWLKFETRIDPYNVYIPIAKEPRDINLSKMFSGVFVYYDSVSVYPTFLGKRRNYSDNQLVTSEGFLYYDRAQLLFKIGSKEKINDFTLAENYISFHREDCNLYNEGNVEIGQEIGHVEMKNYGSVRHEVDRNKTELDLVMALDFHMNENMINLFGLEVDSFPNLEPVDLNKPIIKKTMNAWVGEETAAKVQDELNLFGTIKNLPDELKHTILLNELKLVWNNQTRSYHSIGKIGIASINGVQINKKVNGLFELRIKRSGDVMDLYLELDKRNYYYFGYTRGVMQTLSSNHLYNETIMNMKAKERKLKTRKNSTPYYYLISTDKKKNNFYKRWQDIKNNKIPSDDYFPDLGN